MYTHIPTITLHPCDSIQAYNNSRLLFLKIEPVKVSNEIAKHSRSETRNKKQGVHLHLVNIRNDIGRAERLMKNSSTLISLCITLNILCLGFYFISHFQGKRNNKCSAFLENDILSCSSITIDISSIYPKSYSNLLKSRWYVFLALDWEKFIPRNYCYGSKMKDVLLTILALD